MPREYSSGNVIAAALQQLHNKPQNSADSFDLMPVFLILMHVVLCLDKLLRGNLYDIQNTPSHSYLVLSAEHTNLKFEVAHPLLEEYFSTAADPKTHCFMLAQIFVHQCWICIWFGLAYLCMPFPLMSVTCNFTNRFNYQKYHRLIRRLSLDCQAQLQLLTDLEASSCLLCWTNFAWLPFCTYYVHMLLKDKAPSQA